MTKYKEFYQEFVQKRDKNGVSHSIIFLNWYYADSTLYKLALMELGVDHCSDDEIFPAVFGENWKVVKNKCLSAYYGFDFCAKYCTMRAIKKDKDEALRSVINEERITWERYTGINFDGLINRSLSEKQLVCYTALGLILYNQQTNEFEPNPLFLSDKQYDQWTNPEMIWMTNCPEEDFQDIRNKSAWPLIKVGPPQATGKYSVEYLLQSGAVGMYRARMVNENAQS